LIDKKLIEALFQIHSVSGQEEDMINFITNFLDHRGVKYEVDSLGNISGFNHQRAPLLCAHTDTVQGSHDADLVKLIKLRDNIISGYGVVGGDDKCGIYIILKLLEDKEKINFLLPVMEEVGARGSSSFVLKNKNLFKSIPYCLVLDRRGRNDIISDKNDYCKKDFSFVLDSIGKEFGYRSNSGSFSDADVLSEVVACANLSVGYYNPHSKFEYVNTKDLESAMDFTHAIVKNVQDKFEVPGKNYRKSWIYDFDGLEDDIDMYGKGLREDYAQCDSCGLLFDERRMVYLSTIASSLCRKCLTNLKQEIEIESESNYESDDEFLKMLESEEYLMKEDYA
jgi:tripeptide aminopeptidase